MVMAQGIINQIHSSLVKKDKTIAVAESCTAGLLSNRLTSISGSSKYFILGVVVYSNRAKESILGLSPNLIAKKGAVSKETAKAMAQSVRRMAKADIGISITGIAGPGGATLKKPVGTVFIAIESNNKKSCREFHFAGTRAAIRKKAVLNALKLLKKLI